MIKKLTCNSGNAKNAGAADALNGRTNRPGYNSANSCEGAEYSMQSYQADYNSAYNAKKAEMCQAEFMSQQGTSDANNSITHTAGFEKLKTCGSHAQFAQLKKAYNDNYYRAYCSTTRADKVGETIGQTLKPFDFETQFQGCTSNQLITLKPVASTAYQRAFKAAQIAKTEQFQKTTGTAPFVIEKMKFTSTCSINADKSVVNVQVNNPNPRQFLIQGDWRVLYYDEAFQKLTEDRTTEALLVSPNNRKAFQKMTLPRDATFCRAEFMGGAATK
jgi:hypothetical protein